MKAYKSRDGVQIAAPAERYELRMHHYTDRDVRAVSGSFDALLVEHTGDLAGQKF